MKTDAANCGGVQNDQLLKKKDVATMLACSLRSIDRLVAAGRLTRVRLLGAARFRLSEVKLLMNGGRA